MDTEKRDIFGIDESSVTFESQSRFGQGAAKCVRWLLVILPTVFAVLALVAIVIVSVYYKSSLDATNASLQQRVAQLEAVINQTRIATNGLTDKVDGLNETLTDIEPQVTTSIRSEIQAQLRDTVASVTQSIDQVAQNQRAFFVRWGSSSCPNTTGTVLIYSGLVGGSSFEDQGGGSNHLCMPLDPEYTLPTQPGVQGTSFVYGAEYESSLLGTVNNNVPCAVCSVSTRSQVLMIPAKTSCPTSWIREYYGYLMSEGVLNYRSSFICVDKGHEPVPGTAPHTTASDLWHTEAQCSGLPCLPYVAENELTCVVCSQ